MIQSICLVRLSALGDVLMCLPLVYTLQRHLPHVEITWIISPPAYDLVATLAKVKFIIIDKPRTLRDYWRFKKRLAAYNFDVLLATQASFRANLLYPLIKAKRKIGYDNGRAKDAHRWFIKQQIASAQDHTARGFLRFAEALGISTFKWRWDMTIETKDQDWASQIIANKPILLINPAASKPERSWHAQGYIEVINYAKEKWSVEVILTGGPSQQDLQLSQFIAGQTKCINLTGKTKLMQLLGLIKLAKVMLCPDTGPAHMANAMGTPVVALHAVTNPEVSGPYRFNHLTVNYYPVAVQRLLAKEKRQWGAQVHHPKAMDLIPVNAVIAKLNQAFVGLQF